MKNKKLIIGLGLGIGAYLIWKLNRKKSVDAVEKVKETVESISETGETKTYFKSKDGRVLLCPNGYIGGTKDNPPNSCVQTGGIKPSKTELTNEQVIALFKRANNYYRGGARPTQELIDRIKKDRIKALKEVEQRGFMSDFKSWKAGEDAKNKYNLYPSAPSKGTAVLLKDKKISTRPYGKPIMLNMNRI